MLIGGMVFPLFAALYHWMPLVNGHRLSERLGRWAAALMFAGLNLAFGPMHASGLLGMPRRVHSYADDPGAWGLNLLNALSSAGAFVFAAGIALCFADLLRVLLRPAREPGDPWRSATLEWLPNRCYGPRSMPQVESRTPLWDQPGLAAQVRSGAHWLPGNPTGRREALIGTLREAHPRYLLVLPGDSWLPLLAGAGTAGFFLLLTVGWTGPAWACGAGAIAAVWAWAWELDRDATIDQAPIGRELAVPVGGDGRTGHALAALAILLAVDTSVFLSLLYAHVHVALAATVCPPPGAALPEAPLGLAGLGAWALAALAVECSSRRIATSPLRRCLRATLLLAAAAAAAFALSLAAQQAAGLAPSRDAWSATVAALLGLEGLHTVLIVLLAAFALARAQAGLLNARHRAAFDALRWIVPAAALQVLATTLVVRGLALASG